jgi:hypothetical protein
MRALATVLAILSSAVVCAAVVSPMLPAPERPDREAATNVALSVAAWLGRGHFDVQMSVAAGTNLVQLAFGRDADGDGELSHAETALVVGRGFGEAFVEDVAARRRYAENLTPPAAGRRGLGWRVSLSADGVPTGISATNEAGVAVFSEWRQAPPAWCFDPSWDMVRAVSAGPDDADGRLHVEIGPDGTVLILR